MLLLEHVAVVAASSSLASDITLCREGGQAAGEGAWHQPCPLGVPWVPAQGMTEEGDRERGTEALSKQGGRSWPCQMHVMEKQQC